jgi:hypothetical protein
MREGNSMAELVFGRIGGVAGGETLVFLPTGSAEGIESAQ